MSKKQENELFQRNVEVFSKRYPGCAEKFNNREYERDEQIRVEVEQSGTGNHILTILKEAEKRYLAGKYAPERPMIDWLEKQGRIFHESVFVVVGMGNWIQITNFLQILDKKTKVIIYEPCVEIFEKVMEVYDVAGILEKYDVGLVVEQLNPEYLKMFLAACVHRENMALTKIYISGNYLQLFPELVRNTVKDLKRYFEDAAVNWNTMIRYTDVIGENVLNNIAYFYHGYSINQFKNVLFENVPVIVVSAGPSLNKNIDDLKKAIGKCCIIATDTAIKPLLNRGIIPHFAVIVDGKKPALLFEHPELSKVPLVTCTGVAKAVMNLHRGKKVFYGDGNTYEKNLMEAINEERKEEKLEMTILPSGGSVANSAFSFGYFMGARNIILIGQDLAMTGNKTHADGTFKAKMEDIDANSKQYFEVEAIDGGKVLTRGDFDRYRRWFEDNIKALEEGKTGVRVIDATEGGAKIKGTEIMTLKAAIKEFCVMDFSMEEMFAKMPEMLSDDDKKVLLRYFAETDSKMQEVRKKAKIGINHYEKMLKLAKKKELNTAKYLEYYKKVKKINEFMDSDDIARFVTANLSEMENSMLATMNLTEEDERDERIVVAQKGKVILETMIPMIDKLSDIAKDTVAQYKGDDSILYARYQPEESM